MTTFTRTASRLAARTSLALLLLGFVAVGVWSVNDILGQDAPQKKRVEEEDTAPKDKTPPKKKTAAGDGGRIAR